MAYSFENVNIFRSFHLSDLASSTGVVSKKKRKEEGKFHNKKSVDRIVTESGTC